MIVVERMWGRKPGNKTTKIEGERKRERKEIKGRKEIKRERE